MPIDPVDLRERIALCEDFKPEERAMLLDALNLGEYAGKHVYPPSFGPSSSPVAKLVWSVMDQIRPEAMNTRDRFMLAGMFVRTITDLLEHKRRK